MMVFFTGAIYRRRYSSLFIGLFYLLAVVTGLLLSFAAAAGAAEADSPPIRSAAEVDYPPFSFVSEDGRASGFSVELMRAALEAMNRQVVFRTGPWADVRSWLETGQVQALPLVGRTPERDPLFDFTFPYMSLHGAIVVRKTTADIQTLDDLQGRTVAVMKGDNAEEFLRRQDRDIRIQTTPTFEEALRALARGRYDAVVMQRLVALRLIQKTGLAGLHVLNRPIEGFRQDFCFAVQEGDRDTLALLNEGLALVMADGTYRHLHAKWFAALQLPTGRGLFIGGDHNYPPYEYLDEEGRPAGYNVDLTRAMARAVGLDVGIRLGPWAEVREGLRQGEIDALQGMLYSPERDREFDFTQPHTVNHYVGVVRTRDAMPPSTVQELQNKRLVVQQGDIMHDFLRKNDLESRAVLVDAQEDALRELAGGQHDCALVSRLTAHYWIEQRGWDNLTVGRRPLVSADYCYAVPDGHKAMRSILSKGLKILEQTGEYQRIHDKWLGVYQEDAVDFATIFRYTVIVLLPLILILLVVLLWIWLLRRQVAEKTRAVEENLDRFQYVFEAANVGKSITQPDGSIYPNQAYADFLGYTPAELEEKKWQDLTPAEDIQPTEDLLAPMLAGEKDAVRFEKRYRHKNGQIRWADVSASLRRDAQGTPLYFMTTIVDITERKQTEEALRASEELQRAMIECSPVALYSVDRDGRVLTWNSSAERMFDWRADEVIGRLLPIVPDDMREEFDGLRKQVMSGGSFFGRELTRQDKEDNRIPIRLSSAPIRNDQDAIVGIMAAAEDVSEQARLSTQLSQAQKLESVGRLAGGVAHDYNNMLNVIIGYTELAREKLVPDDPLQEDLQEISDAARRSAEITRQLLAFARRQTIAPRVLDLNETVESMLKMLRRLIGEDIDLAWEPGAELWPVHMDPAQVDQVLANLLINARDAITGVGKITIETDNVRLDENYAADRAGFVSGDYVLLAVSDDGGGMDKKTRNNLFEPFFTTKGVGHGTGLGLATVYGIVRQNDGFINVYSEPGQGATFKIYLPRHAGERAAAPAEIPVQIPRGHGETILVAEDEEAVLQLTQKILTGLGYTVLTASSPTAALAMAEETTAIDLLMTDVVMPEMNGRELAEKVQALLPAGLKILFTSGYTANVIAHHGILEEGVHFIQKPFNRTDLAEKVREALEA